jgi:hypothetical protein
MKVTRGGVAATRGAIKGTKRQKVDFGKKTLDISAVRNASEEVGGMLGHARGDRAAAVRMWDEARARAQREVVESEGSVVFTSLPVLST